MKADRALEYVLEILEDEHNLSRAEAELLCITHLDDTRLLEAEFYEWDQVWSFSHSIAADLVDMHPDD